MKILYHSPGINATVNLAEWVKAWRMARHNHGAKSAFSRYQLGAKCTWTLCMHAWCMHSLLHWLCIFQSNASTLHACAPASLLLTVNLKWSSTQLCLSTDIWVGLVRKITFSSYFVTKQPFVLGTDRLDAVVSIAVRWCQLIWLLKSKNIAGRLDTVAIRKCSHRS